jgi:putative FmdB family regulatory protein
MPVYEYACRSCPERFEKRVSMEARNERTFCPACGADGAERRVSVFAAFGTSGGQTASLGGGCCGGGGGGCACRS